MIKHVDAAPFQSFGADTGDDTVGLKLFYAFCRTVVGRNATNLYYGVRRELGAKGIELFHMYIDMLSGADIDWGYDLEIKLKQEVAAELAMEEQKERMLEDEDEDADESVDDMSDEQRSGKYIELCKKLQQRGVVFGLNVDNCVETTSSVTSDAGSNFWGTREGFEGHRVEHERQVAVRYNHEPRTLRTHCVNHRIDLEQTDDEISRILGPIRSLLMKMRMFWNNPTNYKVCKSLVFLSLYYNNITRNVLFRIGIQNVLFSTVIGMIERG